MSKIRINDLAAGELERKSREILEVLNELGMGAGKTHSSSLESDEADKVRGHFGGDRSAGHGSSASSRTGQAITPKIDLSHISKPGDVMKAILAKKKEAEEEARHPHGSTRPRCSCACCKGCAAPVATPVAPPTAVVAPARPEPRRIVPQPRSAPPIVSASASRSCHCFKAARWLQ